MTYQGENGHPKIASPFFSFNPSDIFLKLAYQRGTELKRSDQGTFLACVRFPMLSHAILQYLISVYKSTINRNKCTCSR